MNKQKIYEELIDTRPDLIDSSKYVGGRKLSCRSNIQKYWEKMSNEEESTQSNKEIKNLTVAYIDYLGLKLNCLFSKYISKPWEYVSRPCRLAKMFPWELTYLAMVNLFQENNLIDFIKIYYEFLNHPQIFPKIIKDQTNVMKRNMYLLFELLAEDYKKTYGKKTYVIKRKPKNSQSDSE